MTQAEAIDARAQRDLACLTPVILSEAKDLIRQRRERFFTSFRMTDSQLLHPHPAVLPDNNQAAPNTESDVTTHVPGNTRKD